MAILRHLDLPTRPPALSPARGPHQPDLLLDAEAPDHLDQTPAFDRGEASRGMFPGRGPGPLSRTVTRTRPPQPPARNSIQPPSSACDTPCRTAFSGPTFPPPLVAGSALAGYLALIFGGCLLACGASAARAGCAAGVGAGR